MAKKFVVVLNKQYQADQLLSALGHVTAGIAANADGRDSMSFVVYRDKDGGEYPNISAWPFIVLRGKAGELKRLRTELIAASLPYSCYLDTMISGGSDAQLQATTTKTGDELQILALATFADSERLDPLTRKFSVWKAAQSTVNA